MTPKIQASRRHQARSCMNCWRLSCDMVIFISSWIKGELSAKEHTWGERKATGERDSNSILPPHPRTSPSFRWTSLGSERRRRSVHLWRFSCHLAPCCFAGGLPHGRREVTHSPDMGVWISHSNLTRFATGIHGYSLLSWHRRLPADVVITGVLISMSVPTSVPCTE